MAIKTPTKAPAAKKSAAPPAGTAVAVRQNNSVVSIKERLAEQAALAASKTAPATGVNIRVTQDKQFRLPNGVQTREPQRFVIVDFNSRNNYYNDTYDANSLSPPDCFALGDNPLQLVPHATAPAKQSTSCNSCPMNQFGSAGAGKACKNTRQLVVTDPDSPDGPLWVLNVSPTALKAFDAYVNDVVRIFGMPPVGVVTTVSFNDAVTYAQLVFSDPEANPHVEAHAARQDEARQLLERLPDYTDAVHAKLQGGTAAKPRTGARPAIARR